MKTVFISIVIVAIVLPGMYCSAATLTSNDTGGGNWTDASSWDGSNTPNDMSAGDTLVILAGDVITLSNTRSFDGVIQIFGTLILDNGKLTMDDTSTIILETGSDIVAQNSGQNESIKIGSSRITSDEINTIVPPTILTEGTLPVEVIYFRAIEMEGTVKLEWATSFEENFDFFTLERSSDAYTFREYAIIYSNTAFSSFTQKYEYIDEMPFPGLSYYRLKATDLDGSFEYHGVVSLNLENIEPDILIYPNPVVGQSLGVSYSGKEVSEFQISDITGKIIQTGILIPGINKISIPEITKSNIYFIKVEGNESSIVMKFAVR